LFPKLCTDMTFCIVSGGPYMPVWSSKTNIKNVFYGIDVLLCTKSNWFE